MPIPGLDPKDCDGSKPAERQSNLDGVQNAFCQARSFCQGVLPLWCRGRFNPPEEYGASANWEAGTYCCVDCRTWRCVGRIVPGPGWRRVTPCARLSTFEHEMSRRRDFGNLFNPPFRGRSGSGVWSLSECRAWCNDLRCLLKLADRFHIVPPFGISWNGAMQTCGPSWDGPSPPLGTL